MIFNCPSCQAGHTVPVSMIPNGGMETTCRRCGTTFAIQVPSGVDDPTGPEDVTDDTGADGEVGDSTEETPTPALPEAELEKQGEATTVGLSNPFDELLSKAGGIAPLMSPTGELISASPEPEDPTSLAKRPQAQSPAHGRPVRAVDLDKPTVPITHGQPVPLGPDEVGVDPELDNTMRVDVDDHAPPGAPTLTTPSPQVSAGARPGSAPRADLYERVAAGAYAPDAAEAKAQAQAQGEERPQRAWNEPSNQAPVARSGLVRVADALNQAPLPAKVGLLVFPIALGVTLMLTAPSRTQSEAVEIPVQEHSERVEPPPASNVEPALKDPDEPPPSDPLVVEPPPPARSPPPAPPPGPAFEDPPAPAGHAYVQVDDARVRARAQSKGPVVAKLEVGTLVRLHEAGEEWSLIMVEPDGPAGFVPKRLLAEQKPMQRLALDMAFVGCQVEGEINIDECLLRGRASQEGCVAHCGPAGQAPARCAEACGAAFDQCSKACFESQTVAKKVPKKHRR